MNVDPGMLAPMTDSLRVWLWVPAVGFAIVYPFALDAFHAAYIIHGWSVAALFYITAAYCVPGFALWAAWRLGGMSHPSARALMARRIALFVVAAPPAFTLLGVILYLMKIQNADIPVWIAMWAVIGVLLALAMLVTDRAAPAPLRSGAPTRIAVLRHLHGWSAAAILITFLAAHLTNHLLALVGVDTHVVVMKMLRHVYRNRWIEPSLIVLLFFQVLSGLVLWRPRTSDAADFLTTLQTGSGAYLAVYLASHVNSVFVLGRHFGIETDWKWATGAPTGVLADAWNIRLFPHYSLAVFLVIAHLSCGLRVVMQAHQVAPVRRDTITWALIGVGVVVAIAITAALLG